jgi:hypothetical protein
LKDSKGNLKFNISKNSEINNNFTIEFIGLLLIFNSLKAILEIYRKIIINPPM